MITDTQRRELRRDIVEGFRSTLRREVGNRTPQQYDKADRLVDGLIVAIDRAVDKQNGEQS